MMSERNLHDQREDDFPVGDVRCVRERLSERFGNHVRKLGEYAHRVSEEADRELGCEIVRKTREPTAPSGKG